MVYQRQRQVYKNTFVTPKARKAFGQMTEEQKEKLEALEFAFELPEAMRGPPPVDWETAFTALAAYAKANRGSTAVPEKTMVPNLNPMHPKIDLGKWCQRQRQLFKNTYLTPHARKNFGHLTEDQKSRLDEIGFQFPDARRLR